ncbi:MAG: archease [Planctomycetota bacterium]|jgi:tRNA nucleotidyltransferase (CCA-adding enzyme)
MPGRAKKAGWEHFPHQADIGIRGVGLSKERAFEQAAVALTAVITNPDKVEAEHKVEISCSAGDEELLLVDWLNCLLCEMGTRKMLFGRFEVRIEGNELEAGAWGEKMDVSKHCPVVEVKAATYAELSVREDEDGRWVAQCVVDV